MLQSGTGYLGKPARLPQPREAARRASPATPLDFSDLSGFARGVLADAVLNETLLRVGVLAVILIALAALGIGVLIVRLRRVAAAWKAAATELGASFDATAATRGESERRIDALIDSVEVAIDTYTAENTKGSGYVSITRLRAEAPLADSLWVYVIPKSQLSLVRRAKGYQDVTIGLDRFDERYAVQTNDESLARSWLDAALAERIAESRAFSFRLAEGEVTARRQGVETETKQLVAAAQATAGLAGAGRRLRQRWEHFAAAQGGKLCGPPWKPWMEVDEQGVTIRIELLQDRSTSNTVTRVRVSVTGPRVERYEIRADGEPLEPTLEAMPELSGRLAGSLVVGSSEPERTERRLSAGLPPCATNLMLRRIESDGSEVAVVIDGMVTDEAGLADAVELATTLAATGDAGPYR